MSDAITMVIGSGEACDLRVDDPYASPRHAAITRRANGTYWIEDLGSTNGTRIFRGQGDAFGTKVYGPTPLMRGDVIRIGRTPIPWTPPA